jgi:ubiquinone/menaquinone biosynthesis C-methylase UbiE
MNVSRHTDDEQAMRWNGPAGRGWVELQEVLDQIYKPIDELLVEAVAVGSSDRVLDVGCGTGGTTVAVAKRLGPKGHCVGIDISEPMLAAAEARAIRAGVATRFVRANAQDHPFEPAHFNRIISRFGVMFFDDPVAAFANLRRAARDDAEFRFVAWRSAEQNPFMTTAERVAAPFLPNIPARKPDAPGQFAFADNRRIYQILEASGWSAIDIHSIDVACVFPEKELVHYLTRLGPVGLILHETDEPTRMRVIETVRAAFDSYVHGTEVRFTAACWMVGARASG